MNRVNSVERDVILERYSRTGSDSSAASSRFRSSILSEADRGSSSGSRSTPSLSRARRGIDAPAETPWQASRSGAEPAGGSLDRANTSTDSTRSSNLARRQRLAQARSQVTSSISRTDRASSRSPVDSRARADASSSGRERARNLARELRTDTGALQRSSRESAARTEQASTGTSGTSRERVQRARRTEARLGELARRDSAGYDRVARIGSATARASSIAQSVGLSVGIGYGYNSYGYGYCGGYDYFDCYYPGCNWYCNPYYNWPSCWYYKYCFGWGYPYYWGSPYYYYCSTPYSYGGVAFGYYYDDYDDEYYEDEDEEYYEEEPLAAQGPRDIAVDPTLDDELGTDDSDSSAAIARERYLELGDQAFYEGRYDDAVHYYAKAVSFAEDNAMLFLVLSDALFATGDYHYGAYALRRALELDPTLARQSTDKRSFYSDPESFDRQLAVLERYLLDRPGDDDARLLLAANYLFGSEPENAIALLDEGPAVALRDDPVARVLLEAARNR